MSDAVQTFDVIVIGGGPAGQKAAIQAAKAGESVLLIERGNVGGECVFRGTIPSKTLRESALHLVGLKDRAQGLFDVHLGPDTKVKSLMRRLSEVLANHQRFISRQLERNGITTWRGRARFLSETELEVTRADATLARVVGRTIFIATGSRPRQPAEIPIDHEHILDSDSILSMIYLPKSLAVVGAGVIACEFASVFQALGVEVTLIDRRNTPLNFLDPELSDEFVNQFESAGGTFLPGIELGEVAFDGVGQVSLELGGRAPLAVDKVLVALGRTASLAGLSIENAGLELSDRGYVPVDENCCTRVSNIYAVGDVIGPPALATASMEQGRRAARHALGLPTREGLELVPVGVYTIPEIGSIGESEQDVRDRGHEPIVGRARFDEIARGQINGQGDGMLKLVCDESGRRVLGAQAIGASATELVHLAQLAILGELPVDVFVDNIFNFPTMAECYRVAALDVIGRRPRAVPLAG